MFITSYGPSNQVPIPDYLPVGPVESQEPLKAESFLQLESERCRSIGKVSRISASLSTLSKR